MLRFLFRLIVLALVVVVGVVGFSVYQRSGADVARGAGAGAGSGAVSGALDGLVDRERVREAGTEIAGAVARSAEQALSEAGLTAKIKSKMALDDTIEAGRLNVDTEGTVVTVRGSVDTRAQRDRALALARETEGVTSVVDRIEVGKQ
jgi:hypothetical protein